MNASKRWAYHFVAGLECLKCRRKGGLKLYDDDILVRSERYTLEELKERVPHLEVWCDDCIGEFGPPLLTIPRPGRLQHKIDAAEQATLRAHAQIASRYDKYTLDSGEQKTKQQIVAQALDKPCNVCYSSYATKLFHQGRNVAAMASGSFSAGEILEVLEESVPTCNECFKEMKTNYRLKSDSKNNTAS